MRVLEAAAAAPGVPAGVADDLGRSGSRRRAFWWVGGLSLGLVATIVVGVSLGPVSISPVTVWESIGHHTVGWPRQVTWKVNADNIVWLVRSPRVLIAATVGAGLAVSGVALQALVRNVLADPFLLGVSSGASTGAAAALLFGFGAPLGRVRWLAVRSSARSRLPE